MEQNSNFLNQLDELIKLFETLQTKAKDEGIINNDDPMYKNFELLAGNYEMIRNTIPPELIEEMGEPIKEMILQMINQLKEELGIDDSIVPTNDDPKDISAVELEEIDRLLKDNSLSEEDVNSLLDKRSTLKNLLD